MRELEKRMDEYFDRAKKARSDIQKILEAVRFDKADEKTEKEILTKVQAYLDEHDLGWNVEVRGGFMPTVSIKPEIELLYFVKGHPIEEDK